jgi:hypothetical protein
MKTALMIAALALAVATHCKAEPTADYVLVIEGYDVTLTATANSEEVARARMDFASTDKTELGQATMWFLYEWARSNGDNRATARERFAIIRATLQAGRYTALIRRKLPQEMRP